MEVKVCRACNKTKSVDSFYKNGRGGKVARCKQCISEGRFIALRAKEPPKFTAHIRLSKTDKEDYVKTYELLEKMGYDLNGDIHLQFCERYDLEPRNPRQSFNFYFSAEDCLDF